jgi:pimeloyl-ACP methyl ester carboxylesterase
LSEHERDHHLDTPGARLRFRDEGAGPSLLFIHGWALDLELWQLQAGELAASHRVLRFDRRGFGLSTGQPSLQADARDVITLLDHLAIERVVLVGASHGARVALRVALASPARVAALVLDGPPDELGGGRGALTVELPLEEYRRLARSGDIEALRRRWSEHPFTQLVNPDAAPRQLVSRMLARYSGADLLQPAEILPPLGSLDPLSMPIRLINGEHDLASRRASSEALARALPRATYVSIPNAGHLPSLDNPDVYNGVLREVVHAAKSPTTGHE